MRRKKIFIGPCEIAGYYANLAKGFREIGIDCDYITYSSHPFDYGGETCDPIVLRWMRLFKRGSIKFSNVFFVRVFFTLLSEASQVAWLVLATFKYDYFIFGFGQSLLRNNWDLKILRFFGKTVITNLGHGSDARPPYIDGSYQSPDGSSQYSMIELCKISDIQFKKVKFLEENSDVILGAPFSTSQFMKGRYINFFSIGVPVAGGGQEDRLEESASLDDGVNHVVRILHSPSHPAVKGTKQIKKAIQNLVDKGYKIELVLLHGRPHAEVIEEIRKCDFVVDQLYSDTPMAGFATEAAWFGKPAVVGGYAFDYLKTLVPSGSWPPSKLCFPVDIEEAIEDLIVDRVERVRLGREAQQFVREKWNVSEVAKRFLHLIDNDVPDEWWLNPVSITYIHGIGLPVERAKENIRQMIELCGVESLQLGHRPGLESAFVEFASMGPRH